ncbi:hypothetical protein MRS44_006107 [Fusarium solani]|uniref:uncharacterized protein n=1 Tax=Fusarium solani TaxID=169388 RepID=UPI0032C3EF06|nr:hypothetical protein MRS44_006107 [Fusarium solani]
MGKKKSSTTKLDSLYDKLEIPQEGKVPCFGHTFSGIPCTTNPKQRKDEIESILHDIIDTIENGCATGSDEVKALLVDLAERLTCEEMHHDHLVPCGRSDCGKHKYVAFVLGKRLRKWDKDSNGETPGSARSNTPTVPQHHKQATSSDDEDEHVEDGDEDYDDEDDDEKLSEKDSEEDDDEVTKVSAKESTKSNRQRPGLHRETAMIDKTACVTPTKQRGRPGRNSRPSTPRTRQPVDAFDSLSVMDEGSPLSPESVISPGVSEIFSPVSTVSTPMSIPDSDIRPRRSRYSRGEDESPTRRRRSSKGDDLTDGARGSRRATDKDPASSLSRTSKYGDDSTATREKLSRKGNKQLDQSSQLVDQDSDSQWQTDDEDEEMEFDEVRKSTNPVGDLLHRLHMVPGKSSRSAGWVYCFAEKTAPGYLKIGYKQYKDDDGNTALSREEQNNKDQVMKRLREWERDCKHNIDYKFIYYMPCAARTMEGLVHLTLHKSKRRARCPNPDCKAKKGHMEWFEISEIEARRAVEVWQQFSNLKPYAGNGRLEDFWFNHTCNDSETHRDSSIKKWLYERWTKVIVPAALRRIELQEKGTQLAEERREAQERKQELEHEIQRLKGEENKIQQELAELQSQR